MNSRRIYIGAVVALIAAVLFIAALQTPKVKRTQQHEAYNASIEDTNLAIDQENFSSHLPVVNIDTGGVKIPGRPIHDQKVSEMRNIYIWGQMQVWEKEDRLNTLADKADIDSDIRIRVRGNSSRRFDKTGYLVKFVNNKGEEKEHEVMGMEKDSTWVLHGPFLDKTLMRNYMWYNLSGKIMEWAPDVRFCELFLNGEYKGVYVMTEQISVGEGRVEVKKYDGKSDVTSYIVCMDRESINDAAYLENYTEYMSLMQGKLEVKYPGAKHLTPTLLDSVDKDFSRFEKALYSYDYDTQRYGYSNYIDVGNFVDYFIINEVTQNTDAGIYSTYFYKDVAGKIKMAVWDFNNSCDNYIEGEHPMAGFTMQDRPWFFMLMKDESFTNLIILRYKELRKGLLSDESMKEYIKDVQEYLGTAVDRNFQVWGYSFAPENDLMTEESRKIGSYEEALDQYENRLVSRMGWLDKHIDTLKAYSHESRNKPYNH